MNYLERSILIVQVFREHVLSTYYLLWYRFVEFEHRYNRIAWYKYAEQLTLYSLDHYDFKGLINKYVDSLTSPTANLYFPFRNVCFVFVVSSWWLSQNTIVTEFRSNRLSEITQNSKNNKVLGGVHRYVDIG